ncbi:hypothetical protein J31TS4_26400 [Paenibacillus sp. J31TS4]|uniref:helix-turn-helix transcriptional regulator n=1 Tax=Paenibacillus sp. J31TS4 TaxID=2807195 RepID=UPI001B2ADC30|nr:AraC family transcriptional regulator [Paenibacillus sp. J31TS4]GIP39360.1 hypothetical protein J31TS4_26400 [Paenibacillus sp. J31TS4]
MTTSELASRIKQAMELSRGREDRSRLVEIRVFGRKAETPLLPEETGLLFLLGGRMDYRIGEDDYRTLRQGEYLFFQEIVTVETEAREGTCCLLVPIRAGLVREFLRLLQEHGALAALPPRTTRRICLLQQEWDAETGRLLAELLRAYSDEDPGRDYSIHLAVLGLLHRLFPDEHMLSKLSYLLDSPTYPEPLRKAERFLLEAYPQPIRMKQLTEAALVSESQLARLYRKHFGMSPMERLASIRMEQAALLLRDPSVTVMEAALQVGYQSLSAFVQQFRKKFGVSPKEYQQSR